MKTLTAERAAKRAARGAARLDRVEPNWFRTVKITKLRLSSSCNCVLGQLERDHSGNGEYFEGLRRLFPRWIHDDDYDDSELVSKSVRHGFNLRFLSQSQKSWEALTEAWRNEIRARRAAAKVAA